MGPAQPRPWWFLTGQQDGLAVHNSGMGSSDEGQRALSSGSSSWNMPAFQEVVDITISEEYHTFGGACHTLSNQLAKENALFPTLQIIRLRYGCSDRPPSACRLPEDYGFLAVRSIHAQWRDSCLCQCDIHIIGHVNDSPARISCPL